MSLRHRIKQSLTVVKRYRYRWLFFIVIGWTIMDQLLWVGRAALPEREIVSTQHQLILKEHPSIWLPTLLRAGSVMLMSWVMGWLLVFRFRRMFRSMKRIPNIVWKGVILIACSFIMNFISQTLYYFIIESRNLGDAIKHYIDLPAEKFWLFQGVPMWLLIFGITQLLIEVNEKYSPGVFYDILRGKYRTPCNERRIIIFLDLKDSTPLAEKLGHQQYFLFIRDFISLISQQLLEQDARIYQYVGDEVVASWLQTEKNARKCVAALVGARKALQEQGTNFRRIYGVQPEFRVGIHTGEVTVGEIGTIKKDLAMSGDTMNTAARIRTSCGELGHKFIASKDFLDVADLQQFQSEYLGTIDLKGKKQGVELYSLKV